MELHMNSYFNRVLSWLALPLIIMDLPSVFLQNVTYESVSYAGFNFSVSDSQLPWPEAVNACKAIGQRLASVETPEKDDILVQLFSEHEHTNVTLQGNSWISAAEVREGVWVWDSLSKPLYYSRWFMDGQPDDKENLNCVYLASTAMLYWRDANCSASMYFICEGDQGSLPTTTTASTTSARTTTTGDNNSSATNLIINQFHLIFILLLFIRIY